MKISDIAKLRLYNQRIAGVKFRRPEEVVRHLGAMQAQDYLGALWAVGLRMQKAVESDIEEALAKKKIIRTWPMRSTLHFVAAEDARWMLNLMTPRILSSYGYRMRYHGITHDTYAKARKLFIKALEGGKQLTREELYQVLDNGGISPKNNLGLHITGRLAIEQLICFGPRRGKKQTMVLLDEWVPKDKNPLSREESMRELAIRYFTSHGPAQIPDIAWWSGLSMKDIRQGIELAGSKLIQKEVEGKTYWMSPNQPKIQNSNDAYLLPPFDEFLVAYKDRSASLETIHAQHVNPGANGMFSPIIVINGQVLGTWKREVKKSSIFITHKPFTAFTSTQKKSIKKAEELYRTFVKK